MQVDWLAGGVTTAAITVVGLIVVLVVEALLLSRGVRWYHALAFPLAADTGTLRRAPKGSGRGFGVTWKVVDGAVVFRVSGPGAPRGLHGTARLHADQLGRVHLDVVWAPAWTPFVAVGWLAVLTASRGDLPLGGVAAAFAAVLLIGNAQAAPRAAAALESALRAAEDQGQAGRPS